MTTGPISVADLLDEHIAAIEEPREPDGKWHPSSYWGCDRKVIYEVRGVEQSNPPRPRNKRVFRIGHILHAFVQESLLSSPSIRAIYPEFLIESKILETGHGDALVELLDGTFVVLEIKSINARGFGFVKNGPKDDHEKQASSYAVQARTNGVWVDAPEGQRWIEALGEKLLGVQVVYLDKETFDIREHWVPYDEAWEPRIIERIAHLEMYRADPESLPPRQPKQTGFPCSWGKGESRGECSFFDRCWNQDGPGVEPVTGEKVPEVFEW